MGDDNRDPAWDLQRGDRLVLAELSNDPTLSAQKLRDILDEENDTDTSCLTLNESIMGMRGTGVFHGAIIPNEDYLWFRSKGEHA